MKEQGSTLVLDAGIVITNQTLADRTRYELTREKWPKFQAVLDRPVITKPSLQKLLFKPVLPG